MSKADAGLNLADTHSALEFVGPGRPARNPHGSPGRPASQQKAGASLTDRINARAHLPSRSVLPELWHSDAVCTLHPEDRRIARIADVRVSRVWSFDYTGV